MINLRLIWFLESNNLLSKLQTGFRAKRSTVGQIVCREPLIWEVFIKKEHLDAVFFHLEKVWHVMAIWYTQKFQRSLPKRRTPIFVKQLLEDQTFQTQVNNLFSDPRPWEIGVPQGSILSIILFIIKINKITTCLPEINGSLYVNDFLICYSFKNMPTIERKIQ